MWRQWLKRNRRGFLFIVAILIVLVSTEALMAVEKAQPEKTPEVQGQAKKEAKPAWQTEAEEKTEETYLQDRCIVSDAKLGSMGDPVPYEYGGRKIRFCRTGCIRQFERDPKMYLKKMDEAIIAKELSDYPLETCIVTGRKLDCDNESPVNYVYNNHLVRFYSDQCIESFEKDPEKYLNIYRKKVSFEKNSGARKKRTADMVWKRYVEQTGFGYIMEPKPPAEACTKASCCPKK